MKFQIKNRFTGEVQFECELTAEIAEKEYSLRMGFAINEAIKQNADLSSANLSYANLRSADLRSADLRSADLRSTNLRSADLSSADLSFADLRSADLRSTNLSYANLSYANLRSKYFNDEIIYLQPIQISGFNPYHIIIAGTYLKIGCELHSIQEWSKFKVSRIKLMDENAAKWWKEHKSLIMPIAENHMTKHLIEKQRHEK